MLTGMMKRLTDTKWVSVAALAATTFLASPVAMADTGLKTQIKTQHNPGYRDRGHNGSQTVLFECGSSDYRLSSCRLNVGFRVVDARVHDRKSNASCNEGKEWGIRGDEMWIRGGCRAIFMLSSTQMTAHHNDRYYEHDTRGRDYGYNDRGHDPRGYQHISHRDEVSAIGSCAREANQAAYRGRFYSAQYKYEPNVRVGAAGRLRVTGTMRVHGPDGFRNRDTLCVVERNGRIRNFEFTR